MDPIENVFAIVLAFFIGCLSGVIATYFIIKIGKKLDKDSKED